MIKVATLVAVAALVQGCACYSPTGYRYGSEYVGRSSYVNPIPPPRRLMPPPKPKPPPRLVRPPKAPSPPMMGRPPSPPPPRSVLPSRRTGASK